MGGKQNKDIKIDSAHFFMYTFDVWFLFFHWSHSQSVFFVKSTLAPERLSSITRDTRQQEHSLYMCLCEDVCVRVRVRVGRGGVGVCLLQSVC